MKKKKPIVFESKKNGCGNPLCIICGYEIKTKNK